MRSHRLCFPPLHLQRSCNLLSDLCALLPRSAAGAVLDYEHVGNTVLIEEIPQKVQKGTMSTSVSHKLRAPQTCLWTSFRTKHPRNFVSLLPVARCNFLYMCFGVRVASVSHRRRLTWCARAGFWVEGESPTSVCPLRDVSPLTNPFSSRTVLGQVSLRVLPPPNATAHTHKPSCSRVQHQPSNTTLGCCVELRRPESNLAAKHCRFAACEIWRCCVQALSAFETIQTEIGASTETKTGSQTLVRPPSVLDFPSTSRSLLVFACRLDAVSFGFWIIHPQDGWPVPPWSISHVPCGCRCARSRGPRRKSRRHLKTFRSESSLRKPSTRSGANRWLYAAVLLWNCVVQLMLARRPSENQHRATEE